MEDTHQAIADALKGLLDRGEVGRRALKSLSRSLHQAANRIGSDRLRYLANRISIDAMG